MNPHRFSSHLNKSKSTAVAAGPSHVTQAKAAAPDTRSLRELLESHDEAALRRGLTQLPEGECTPGDLSATAEERLLDALPHACISSLHVGLMHNPDRYLRAMQSSTVRVWDCCHARVAKRGTDEGAIMSGMKVSASGKQLLMNLDMPREQMGNILLRQITPN